jgi:hypothetical protein
MTVKVHLAAVLAAAALIFAVPVSAEPMTIPMAGVHKAYIAGHANVAIPAYHVNFITSHQATASASIMAKSRLAMVLEGPTPEMMRTLTDEAYDDLVAQLAAAGVTVLSPEQAATVAASMEKIPGNFEKSDLKAGITIGKSLKRGWATFGATKAPALVALRHLNSPNGGLSGGFGRIELGKMNKTAGAADAIAVMPSLTIDFAAMSADTGNDFLGRAKASAEGKVGFSVLMASPVMFQNPAKTTGMGTPGMMYPKKDAVSSTKFATVEEGGAAVRVGSLYPIADSNYITVQRARGDAVVADAAVWEGLVRDAYKAYNAAIVKAIVDNR